MPNPNITWHLLFMSSSESVGEACIAEAEWNHPTRKLTLISDTCLSARLCLVSCLVSRDHSFSSVSTPGWWRAPTPSWWPPRPPWAWWGRASGATSPCCCWTPPPLPPPPPPCAPPSPSPWWTGPDTVAATWYLQILISTNIYTRIRCYGGGEVPRPLERDRQLHELWERQVDPATKVRCLSRSKYFPLTLHYFNHNSTWSM